MRGVTGMKPANHTFAICAYQESPYLEACIRSVLGQTVKTNVLIATSTPNAHIRRLAEKYGLPLYINEGEHGITQDWNFAYSRCTTDYITIAHQDDLYHPKYVERLLDTVEKAKRPLIYFTDYAEIRKGKRVSKSRLLTIKRIMLTPLRFRGLWNSKWIRRRILSLGCPICCPSVTFVRQNVPREVFRNHFRASEDWEAWEYLSQMDGAFVYCSQILTFHRIHEDSETSHTLREHKRAEEDYEMFCKFWPKPVAKLLTGCYAGSEKNNEL